MKKIILLIIAITTLTILNAQQKFTNYTSKNTITAIADDGSKVWIGTAAGLYARSKSTGAIVLTYNADNVLPSSFVNDVLVDPFGNLWVATRLGLAKFDGSTWTIYNKESGLKHNNVKNITIDQSGTIWVAYYISRSFSKLNSDTTWTHYLMPYTNAQTTIRTIHVDYNNNIWIGSYGAGAYKFDGNNFTQYKKMGSTNRVYDIITDANGDLWFASYNGLAKYDFSTWSFYTTDQGLADNSCKTLTSDLNGDIWIGHYANGVTRFTPSDSSVTTYNESDGLKHQYIRAVMIDSDAKLWVGSRYGLYTYDGTDWSTFMVNNSISSNQVYDVAIAQDSAVWVGTEYGLSKLKDNTWTSYFSKDGLIQDRVKTVAVDPNGNIWTGTNYGLTFFDGTDFTTYNYSKVRSATDIFTCADGSIWVTTTYYGLTHYDGSTWTNYNTDDGLLDNYCTAVFKASSGKIWAATWSGISVWDGSDFTNYTTSDGLPSDHIYTVFEDDTNAVWALTLSGIAIFNGTSWDKKTDIPSNYYKVIGQSNDHNIWLGTLSGIVKSKEDNFATYTTDDGLASDKVYSVAMGVGGEKWFGTDAGLSKVTCEAPEPLFEVSKTCLPEATSFTNTSTKIDATTSYEWDILNDGTIDTNSINTGYTFPSEDTYSVSLKAYNDECSAKYIGKVKAYNIPVVSLNHTGTFDICNGSSAHLVVTADKITYDYEWSNEEDSSIVDIDKEGTYTVTVTNKVCDASPLSVTVHLLKPFAPKICMVTVDTAEGKNLIVWEKPVTSSISYFNIFKEETTDNYRLIGTKFYDELSEFVDPTSAPGVHADKYKISAVDTCGNQSDLSAFHQTMNLSQAQGSQEDELVLLWNKYIDESGDYMPSSYKIYRGTNTHDLTLEHELTGGLSTYNYNVSSVVDKEKFIVVIDMPTCTPTRATGGPYYQSTSNLEDEGIVSNDEEDNDDETTNISNVEVKNIIIYPNPNNGRFTILFPTLVTGDITIYNNIGQSVYTYHIEDEKELKITDALAKGVYLIKTNLDHQKDTTQRIIIQ